MITRLKSTLTYQCLEAQNIAVRPCNENVLSDHAIELKSAKQPWRLITWRSPEGVTYEYLTNDFSLEPGVVAFLYYRRWDEEKYFDNFKNDLANAKAWGSRPEALEQQALMGMMTYTLTRLFLQRRCQELGLDGDQTQARKYRKKIEAYIDQKVGIESQHSDDDELLRPKFHDAYRAF